MCPHTESVAPFRGQIQALLAPRHVRLRLPAQRRGLVGLVLAVVLTTAAPALAGTTEAQNKAAAEKDAASLLAAAMLPDGATPLDAAPQGDGGALSAPGTPTGATNAVLRTKWFRIAAPSAEVVSFVDAHVPAGMKLAVSGSGDTTDGRTVDSRTFARPRVIHRLGMRWLIVSMTRLDDGATGVRVDGYSQWLIPRPDGSLIRGARDLSIEAGKKKLHVTDRKRVTKLARLFNDLEFEQPGAVLMCPRAPANKPVQPRLSFRAHAGGRLLGSVRVRPGGCPSATMVVGGARYGSLDLLGATGAAFIAELRKLGALPRPG